MTDAWGNPTFARRSPTAQALDAPQDYGVTAHAEAAAKLLDGIVQELRRGRAPEELGANVCLIGAMMERRV